MTRVLPLPPGWGRAVLDERVDGRPAAAGAVRSYDHRGVRLAWHPPEELRRGRRFACDIEHAGRDAGVMAARFGLAADAFLDAWVLTEVAAKLADQPILSWLKEHGLVTPARAGEPMSLGCAAGAMTLLLVPNAPSDAHLALGFAPGSSVRGDARENPLHLGAHSVACAAVCP
jgi:hypothetical protein